MRRLVSTVIAALALTAAAPAYAAAPPYWWDDCSYGSLICADLAD